MCFGTTLICTRCSRRRVRYTRQCENNEGHPVYGHTYRMPFHRCDVCNPDSPETQEEHNQFQGDIERAKRLMEYMRGELPTPYTPEELIEQENDSLESYAQHEALHPYRAQSEWREHAIEVADIREMDAELTNDLEECLRRQREIFYIPGRRITQEDIYYRYSNILNRLRTRQANYSQDNNETPSLPQTPNGATQCGSRTLDDQTDVSPLNFLQWSITNDPQTQWRESPDFRVRADIQSYIDYLQDFPHEHLAMVANILSAFDEDEYLYDFVPTSTSSNSLQSFRAWLEDGGFESPHDGQVDYCNYLRQQNEEQQSLIFWNDRQRLARNHRRFLNFHSGGQWEDLELATTQECQSYDSEIEASEGQESGSEGEEEGERAMTFAEWIQAEHYTMPSHDECILSDEERLQTEIHAYENDYLGMFPFPRQVAEFREMRRQIESNRFNFDFEPIDMDHDVNLMTFREFLEYESADITNSKDWEMCLTTYQLHLEMEAPSPIAFDFAAARSAFNQANRREFERSQLEVDRIRPILQTSPQQTSQQVSNENPESCMKSFETEASADNSTGVELDRPPTPSLANHSLHHPRRTQLYMQARLESESGPCMFEAENRDHQWPDIDEILQIETVDQLESLDEKLESATEWYSNKMVSQTREADERLTKLILNNSHSRYNENIGIPQSDYLSRRLELEEARVQRRNSIEAAMAGDEAKGALELEEDRFNADLHELQLDELNQTQYDRWDLSDVIDPENVRAMNKARDCRLIDEEAAHRHRLQRHMEELINCLQEVRGLSHYVHMRRLELNRRRAREVLISESLQLRRQIEQQQELPAHIQNLLGNGADNYADDNRATEIIEAEYNTLREYQRLSHDTEQQRYERLLHETTSEIREQQELVARRERLAQQVSAVERTLRRIVHVQGEMTGFARSLEVVSRTQERAESDLQQSLDRCQELDRIREECEQHLQDLLPRREEEHQQSSTERMILSVETDPNYNYWGYWSDSEDDDDYERPESPLASVRAMNQRMAEEDSIRASNQRTTGEYNRDDFSRMVAFDHEDVVSDDEDGQLDALDAYMMETER